MEKCLGKKKAASSAFTVYNKYSDFPQPQKLWCCVLGAARDSIIFLAGSRIAVLSATHLEKYRCDQEVSTE